MMWISHTRDMTSAFLNGIEKATVVSFVSDFKIAVVCGANFNIKPGY